MPQFDDLDACSSASLKDIFAEPALLRSRAHAPYSEHADTGDDTAVILQGVFSAGPSESDLHGQSKGGGFAGATRVSSMSAEFWVPASELTYLTSLPSKGDALTLTARPGAPVYAVSRADHTDMGDLTLILVREDTAS
jgi:hypothetical protein